MCKNRWGKSGAKIKKETAKRVILHYLAIFLGDSVGIRPGGRIPYPATGQSSKTLVFVIPLGLEPKTHSLEGCCSIQLSYGT